MIRDIVRLFRRIWHSLFNSSITRQTYTQPIPDVTAEDVVRVVRRDFPENQFETVMAILNEYGIEAWHKDKKSRVRLATLKLAHGDLAALKRAIETAKQDFRDVLGPAEYPESMQAWAQLNRMSRKERERVVKSDWEQYETWLHGDVKQVQP